MTTTSAKPDTTPQVLQTYTLLHIAAEAMFGQPHATDAAAAGFGAIQDPSFGDKAVVLTLGNGHSSRFTAQQAVDFAENWRVVSHQPNTDKPSATA